MTGEARSATLEPSRVLVMVEQEAIAELIKLTLNHGVFHARDAQAHGRRQGWRRHGQAVVAPPCPLLKRDIGDEGR